MARYKTQPIPTGKFLSMSANLLHRAFIETNRTSAKQAFRELAGAGTVPIATVKMEDDSTVRFRVALDHSEFRGRFNYGAFRASLTTLLANIARALREGKQVPTFAGSEGKETTIFGVAAVTVEEGTPSVMVLGADLGAPGSGVLLRLMYLDPAQFEQRQVADTPGDADPAGEDV
jgi:hypothetical protein